MGSNFTAMRLTKHPLLLHPGLACTLPGRTLTCQGEPQEAPPKTHVRIVAEANGRILLKSHRWGYGWADRKDLQEEENPALPAEAAQ
jgi:hypothetical protein